MKKIWKIASIFGLVALVFGTAGLVYAQTGTPQPYTNPGYGSGMMGGRGGFGGGMHFMDEGPYHDVMLSSFAEAIGLTVDQLDERLAEGETMWQIAESEGATWDEFIAIMQEARSSMLEQAVEDGSLSQDQADFMHSRWQERGFGRGNGGCMGVGQIDPQEFQRGPGGSWRMP
jgi:hypothetical protein